MLLIATFIILILSVSVNIVFLVLVKNLARKLEIYEGWIAFFQSEILEVDRKLKAVDVVSGTEGTYRLFEKDDDVGFVFSEISRIIAEFALRVK